MSVDPINVQQLAGKYKTFAAAKEALSNGKMSTEQFNELILFQNKQPNSSFYDAEQENSGTVVAILVDGKPYTLENLEADKKNGTISEEEYNLRKAKFSNSGSGTTVETNPDKTKPTVEEQHAKAEQRQAELDEVAKMKQVSQNGVKTEDIIINSENGVLTSDLKAPTKMKEKHTKQQEQYRMARYYDEELGYDIMGEEALGDRRKDIKKAKKAAKKDLKAATKELREARKELANLEIAFRKGQATAQEVESARNKVKTITAKQVDAADRRTEATEEYEQVKQAHKAAQGYGIGGDTRAYNKNVKANNRLVKREVYFTEAEADAARSAPGAENKKIKVLSNDDQITLQLLASTAERHLDEASSPNEKALWRELANLFKDENGKPVNPDTDKVQDALIDLTGGDMRLNYTEQKMISEELGVSMGDVRSLFRTYGFEAPHPLGKRLATGAKEALPVAATMGLSYLLTRNKAHAEDHHEAHSHNENTVTVKETVTNTQAAHAEVDIPGQSFKWFDPETGEEIIKHIAGAHAEDTQYATAVATAQATATSSSDAFASSTAVAEAVAKLSPAGLIAAPVLAFLAGATKKPVEISAAQAGATTQKMATYVNAFRKNKNKNIGNQIVQMAGRITGNKAYDRAIIVAVLNKDIGAQNTIPTTRELRNALAHLDAIKREVDKFKHVPPPPEPSPVPSPTPTPECNVEINERKTSVSYVRKGGDSWGGIVDAYYPDCVKVHGRSATIRALKKAIAKDDNDYKAILREKDVRAKMELPPKLLDCDITLGNDIKKIKVTNVKGKINNKSGGTKTFDYNAQDCDNRNYRGDTPSEVESQVRKNNPDKKINIHVNNN